MNTFTWHSTVRAHEIDVQGIVNNAHYFSYFDHARTLYLLEEGAHWADLSKAGFHLVLAHADIRFLHALKPFDAFKVTSRCEREGRLKLIFYQTIVHANNTLICTGVNTIVCVDNEKGKPVALDKIAGLKPGLGNFSHSRSCDNT